MRSQPGICPGSVWGPSQTHAWVLGLFLLAAVQTTGCASQPSVNAAPAGSLQAITDFRTLETPETFAVMVKSDRPLAGTAVKQENPRGVLLRFPATILEGLESVYFLPSNPVVRSIRTTETVGDGRETQVFLELTRDLPYEVHADAEGLKITFPKSVAGAPGSRKPAVSGLTPKPAKAPPAETAPAATLMREVRVEARAEEVIIRVRADGPVTEVRTLKIDEDPARIVFDLIGLRSAYSGEQKVPVRSPWVSQVRHAGHPDKVRLVVETTKAHLNDFVVDSVPDGLVIRVGRSAAPSRQNAGRTAADSASGEKR